jgi:hypothetical protein
MIDIRKEPDVQHTYAKFAFSRQGRGAKLKPD